MDTKTKTELAINELMNDTALTHADKRDICEMYSYSLAHRHTPAAYAARLWRKALEDFDAAHPHIVAAMTGDK